MKARMARGGFSMPKALTLLFSLVFLLGAVGAAPTFADSTTRNNKSATTTQSTQQAAAQQKVQSAAASSGTKSASAQQTTDAATAKSDQLKSKTGQLRHETSGAGGSSTTQQAASQKSQNVQQGNASQKQAQAAKAQKATWSSKKALSDHFHDYNAKTRPLGRGHGREVGAKTESEYNAKAKQVIATGTEFQYKYRGSKRVGYVSRDGFEFVGTTQQNGQVQIHTYFAPRNDDFGNRRFPRAAQYAREQTESTFE
jgi:hypothetical protein